MSFDPFETRLQFLQLLKKLNASQPSIQKVVAFALRYGSRCGEDLWECIAEECGKVSCLISFQSLGYAGRRGAVLTPQGSLNTRINIFYLLDSLAEASLGVGPSDAPYVRCMARDLGRVVESVVPPTKEGVLNLKAVKQVRASPTLRHSRCLQSLMMMMQILDSWRTRRILDPSVIDPVVEHLDNRSMWVVEQMIPWSRAELMPSQRLVFAEEAGPLGRVLPGRHLTADGRGPRACESVISHICWSG